MSMMGQEQQQCPACHHDEAPIIEHRGVRRRRECRRCKHRWTTYEITAERLEKLETIEQHAAAIAEAMAERET